MYEKKSDKPVEKSSLKVLKKKFSRVLHQRREVFYIKKIPGAGYWARSQPREDPRGGSYSSRSIFHETIL